MARPRPLPYEARVDDLLVTYRQAQRRIVAQVKAAVAAGDLATSSRRRAQLAAVLQVLDELGMQTDRQARELVRDAFQQSARVTGSRIARIGAGVEMNPAAFAAVERDAVEAMQAEILGRLDAARTTIGRQVEDVFARAGRRTVLSALLGAHGSPQAARRELQRQVTEKGVTAFVDRSGRQWALDTYSEMAVRTTTREAVVEGAKTRMAAQGIDLARVSHHVSACPICAPWEDRIVSLTGTTGDYQGEAVTDLASLPNGGPPFHPNCRHTLLPVATTVEALLAEGVA
jgi:hypothetical protein